MEYRLADSPGQALRANSVRVTLEQQAPQGTIRYTLDGTEPGARSRRYTGALTMKPGATIAPRASTICAARVPRDRPT